MPKLIKEEIEVVSSRKAERLVATGAFIAAALALSYALLTPELISYLEAHGGFKARLLFLPPFLIQKFLGVAFALGYAVYGIFLWRRSADRRLIMTINREGIRTATHLISWEEVREVHFYKNGYLFYLLDDTHSSIKAAGSGIHRDLVLEVVKAVKPAHVRIEYFNHELPSVAPKLAPFVAAGVLANMNF